jgi:hypothetical protein
MRSAGGEVWKSVAFDVSEYTLVFQRVSGERKGRAAPMWVVVRPLLEEPHATRARQSRGRTAGIAEFLAVPICSALALDGVAYERFLFQSGVLDDVVEFLSSAALSRPESVATVRKQIQAMVMAAEVDYIVERLPA